MNHAGIHRRRESARRRHRSARIATKTAQKPSLRVLGRLCAGIAGGVFGFVLLACGQSTEEPEGGQRARSFATLPLPPSPPTAGLVMPAFDGEWTPPMLTAGDPAALGVALASAESWSLWVDARLARDGQGMHLRAVLADLGGVQVAEPSRLEGGVGNFLGGVALPLDRLPLARGGRPRYGSTGMGPIAAPGGESGGAALVVGNAMLDLPQWNALEAVTVGSCAPAFRDLAEGQEASLALLEPYFERGDAILWRSFRAGLARELPALRKELEPYAELRPQASFPNEQERDRYLCGQAYWRYIDIYHRCQQSAQSCLGAPRIFLQGSLQIGLPGPDTSSLGSCPELLGRDYVASVRELAEVASRDAIHGLDDRWSVLADRLGIINEVYAVLEDICVPRRRRFSAAAVSEARRRLSQVVRELGSADHEVRAAGWVTSEDYFEIAGVGRVAELARFDGVVLNQEIRAHTRALRESIFDMARCRHPSDEQPLVVLALRDGAASFLGYFFEEELLCGDLPALRGFDLGDSGDSGEPGALSGAGSIE